MSGKNSKQQLLELVSQNQPLVKRLFNKPSHNHHSEAFSSFLDQLESKLKSIRSIEKKSPSYLTGILDASSFVGVLRAPLFKDVYIKEKHFLYKMILDYVEIVIEQANNSNRGGLSAMPDISFDKVKAVITSQSFSSDGMGNLQAILQYVDNIVSQVTKPIPEWEHREKAGEVFSQCQLFKAKELLRLQAPFFKESVRSVSSPVSVTDKLLLSC